MRKLITISALFAVALTGCAAKHEMPNGSAPFAGDKALSLAGNMELLAGNSSVVNRDQDMSEKEMASAAAAVNTAAIAGHTAIDAVAAGGLTAGNLAFGVGSAMMLLQENYSRPDVGMLIIMPLDTGDVPTSQATLEKAFKYGTNPNAEKIKKVKFAMRDGSLITSTDGEELVAVKFSTLVAYDLVKRIDPKLPAGNYAAFGMVEPSFSGNHFGYYDFSDKTWTHAGSWTKGLAHSSPSHDTITYKVDKVGEPNAKTMIIKYVNTDSTETYTNKGDKNRVAGIELR